MIYLEALGLKKLDRQGWIRKGIPQCESVAAHSWGVSWLVLNLLPSNLNLERALTYSALHDLPEVRVGDLTPADNISKEEKSAKERQAMTELCASLPRGPYLLRAWEAYEAQADAEATFVKQLDRLDMALQALAYARHGYSGMDEFIASAQQSITHPSLQRVLNETAALLDRTTAKS